MRTWTPVVTAAKTSDLLNPKRYAKVIETGWNETAHVGPATFRAFEVKHWGARLRRGPPERIQTANETQPCGFRFGAA